MLLDRAVKWSAADVHRKQRLKPTFPDSGGCGARNRPFGHRGQR